MTSTGDRRRDDAGSSSSLVAGTRFFKIILQSTLRDRKLLIPGKFVGNGDEGLPKSAILKVPSGATWAVDVVRDEIGVWFSNGWGEFAEFHSLEFGHFLVFEYEGCSRFSVVICDKTACEITYPIPRTCEANVEGIGDCFDTRTRKKSKSLIEVSQRQVQSKKKMRMKDSISDGIPESRRASSISPSFFITISQYMEKYATVPIDFVIKHMKLEKSTVMVYGEDGLGPWCLSFVFRPDSKPRKGRGRGFFCGGWSTFCNGNSLKLGDVCRFKLISSNKMEVTIQRNQVDVLC